MRSYDYYNLITSNLVDGVKSRFRLAVANNVNYPSRKRNICENSVCDELEIGFIYDVFNGTNYQNQEENERIIQIVGIIIM